jgi:hypothetical protein
VVIDARAGARRLTAGQSGSEGGCRDAELKYQHRRAGHEARIHVGVEAVLVDADERASRLIVPIASTVGVGASTGATTITA